ncbi:hypothetical protein MTO96_047362, partial [Rhipicephalus appendiculatus]
RKLPLARIILSDGLLIQNYFSKRTSATYGSNFSWDLVDRKVWKVDKFDTLTSLDAYSEDVQHYPVEDDRIRMKQRRDATPKAQIQSGALVPDCPGCDERVDYGFVWPRRRNLSPIRISSCFQGLRCSHTLFSAHEEANGIGRHHSVRSGSRILIYPRHRQAGPPSCSPATASAGRTPSTRRCGTCVSGLTSRSTRTTSRTNCGTSRILTISAFAVLTA